MKKRILALALAGTTAFSVFGGLNVFAATQDALPGDATDEFVSYEAIAISTDTYGYIILAPQIGSMVEEYVNTPADVEIFNNALSSASTSATIENGYIYLYDYEVKGANTAAKDANVAAFKAAVAAVAAYEDGFITEAEYKKLNETQKGDWRKFYGTGYYIKNTVNENAAVNAMKEVWTAWDEAYGLVSGSYGSNATRNGVIVTFYSNWNEFQKLKEDSYDEGEWKAYDMDALKGAFSEAAAGLSDLQTSEIVYLNQQYAERKAAMAGADYSDEIDLYEHYLEAATALTESDYSATNWAKVEYNIKLAEANAALAEETPSKWNDAIQNLLDALNVTPEKGDYTELRDTLMSMYADSKGQTKASYIKKDYTASTTKYQIYRKKDYTVNKKTTDEWDALFKNSIWYYNPLDAVMADNAESKYTYAGIYGYAYVLYREAINGKVAQSRLDMANEMLIEAIADLDPTTSSAEWELVKLEKTVELAETLVDTDFNANSTKWKTFTKNLEKAQEILAKSNASKSEVTNITTALNGSMMALESVAKNPSYTLVKEYKAVLKDAKDALKEIEDQNATQYKTLMAAINAAENLGTWLDVNEKDKDCYVALSSDYEEAIANLEAAIAGYEHPQGWYQDEAGTWFYGVGTENYTGWLEINGRNYFLKDDGSMAASTWVKTDKGYWYYLNESGIMLHDGWGKVNGSWYYFKNFGAMAEGWVKDGNTWYYLTPGSGKMVTGWNLINGKYYYFDASGAMLANTTTPDGYKVDASGAWIQ